jgi:glycosyltransferase involved in cell wall biosynthesis
LEKPWRIEFNKSDSMDGEGVTLGVPVYRGAHFLKDTLQSIQAQTHREIEVLISIDGAEPESEKLCQQFLKDSRFRLVIQPARLGWVGNINWLMSQVRTAYWCYQQQDDLIDPRYLELLLSHARVAPEAAVTYCDIEAFGAQTWKHAQPSVTGSASARQLALLYDHHPAVAFRGLTRIEALRHSGGPLPNVVENFSADTTWMSAVARWGELHRVPSYLYRKRYHDDNTHVKWQSWPAEQRSWAWTVHCADMLEQAMLVDSSAHERRLLWLAAVARLVSRVASVYILDTARSFSDRMHLLHLFFKHVRERDLNVPRWLDMNWDEIQPWTSKFYAVEPADLS